MHNWADQRVHYLKRHLSVMEKSSLVNTTGRAVVFPGSPNTEIEELVAAGFDPSHVYGLESEQYIADHLYTYYWDQASIHWEEAGMWLRRAHGPFCYAHLDFCGHLSALEVDAIEALAGKLDPISRVRVTTFQSRRGTDQLLAEEIYHEQMTHALVRMVGDDEVYAAQAAALLEDLEAQLGDSTIAVLGLVLLNFTFGVAGLSFSDARVQAAGGDLPAVRGTHRVSSVERFSYNESHNASVLSTVWIDLVPLPHPGVNVDGEWAKREVLQVLGMVTNPILAYRDPSLFGKD